MVYVVVILLHLLLVKRVNGAGLNYYYAVINVVAKVK